MTEQEKNYIEKFLSVISPWRSGYRSAWVTYVGYEQGGHHLVLSARLYLSTSIESRSRPTYQAGAIVAGQVSLPATADLRKVMEALLTSDGYEIPGHGLLRLPTDENRLNSLSEPTLFHADGLANGDRLAVLNATGASRHSMLLQPETDWTLKASPVPYDSVQELFLDYGLGPVRGSYSELDVIAVSAVEILNRSTVAAEHATLGLFMPTTLDPSKAHLGYRVISKGKVSSRGSLSGSQLNWQQEGNYLTGVANLTVPADAVIQCFACYEGHAHQTRWLMDPSTVQNPRAAVLSLVESSGQLLQSYLLPDLPPRAKAADDFESAVCWSLWALGFAPCAFGLHPKTRDAFDIVAVSPKGEFLVVECTLGLLRADSKLSKLAARAAALRQLLRGSNFSHLRVLPVIVTAMTKDEISADADQARQLGIVVVTRENLERLQEEILRAPDGDRYFTQAIQSLNATSLIESSGY